MSAEHRFPKSPRVGGNPFVDEQGRNPFADREPEQVDPPPGGAAAETGSGDLYVSNRNEARPYVETGFVATQTGQGTTLLTLATVCLFICLAGMLLPLFAWFGVVFAIVIALTARRHLQAMTAGAMDARTRPQTLLALLIALAAILVGLAATIYLLAGMNW